MSLTQKLGALCSTEGIPSKDAEDFVRECLDLWVREKDPVAAFCLACLLEWHGTQVGQELFEARGLIPNPKDFNAEAFNRFKELAEAGSSEAARYVALFYQGGTYPVEADLHEVRKWLIRALELGDTSVRAELDYVERRLRE